MYDCKNQNNTALVGPTLGSRTGIAKIARKGSIFGGAAVAMMLLSSPAALAETCTFTGPAAVNGQVQIVGTGSSIAGNIVSAITTAQSAFLLQSTAFVSGPGNPMPEQQGSGVWTRAVGGSVNIKNPSTQTTANSTNPPVAGVDGVAGSVTCNTAVHTDFVGVQFGHDVAKLNWNGWNVHFGTTAGYLESRGSTRGGDFAGNAFTNTVQSPFAGTYLAVQNGGFFADALLRAEYYQATFNAVDFGINNQNLNARGVTAAFSAGYNYAIPNTKWFVEPSGGFIVSRTSVDAFNLGGAAFNNGLPGAVKLNDIKSEVGRLGLRVGTTVQAGQWVLTPFGAASVWHEFASAPTGTFSTDHTFLAASNLQITSNYTGTSVGTYGQYSLGVAGQLLNTGWVAFARVDYRKGSQIDGWDGTGGFRYHFTPDAPIPVIGKAPVYKAAPVMAAFNWTGWYLGGSAGAAFGSSKMEFPGSVTPTPRGAGFMGGGQVGYNYQFDPKWVAGIEAAVDWTNLNGARECDPLPLYPVTSPNYGDRNALYNTTCHFKSNWLASLTGRVGYVWGRALYYVKGGAAFTRETVNVTCNGTPGVSLNCTGILAEVGTGGVPNAAFDLPGNGGSASINRIGATIGYGLEFAMTPNWTARAESNLYEFGSRSTTLSDGIVVRPREEIITTKIGVNYKFN